MIGYIRVWCAQKIGRRAITSLEYALIAAFVAIVIVSSVAAVGNSLKTPLNTVSSKLTD